MSTGGEQDHYNPKGWYSRGYLPHLDAGNVVQMVTFRLADSFPQSLLATWRDELACMPQDDADRERRKRIETFLDTGAGVAWLNDPRIAHLVQQSIIHFDGERYRLHAWVIMPNHVHILLTTFARHPLSAVVHSWKSYTSHAANRLLRRTGDFWHREFFDRYVRNEQHFAAAVSYIEANPVRAGLCSACDAWPYSSAAHRPI